MSARSGKSGKPVAKPVAGPWRGPRIRTLKHTFFQDEKMARFALCVRLTFLGLITHADDEGRLKGDPRLLKAWLWPLDDSITADDVRLHLEELASGGDPRIYWYEIDGIRYIALRHFNRHQYIQKPTRSAIPAPPGAPPRSVGPSDSPPVAVPDESGGMGKEGMKEWIEEEGDGAAIKGAIPPLEEEDLDAGGDNRMKHPVVPHPRDEPNDAVRGQLTDGPRTGLGYAKAVEDEITRNGEAKAYPAERYKAGLRQACNAWADQHAEEYAAMEAEAREDFASLASASTVVHERAIELQIESRIRVLAGFPTYEEWAVKHARKDERSMAER